MGSLAFFINSYNPCNYFYASTYMGFANGFVGDERFEITVAFGRVMFPYILLISLQHFYLGC